MSEKFRSLNTAFSEQPIFESPDHELTAGTMNEAQLKSILAEYNKALSISQSHDPERTRELKEERSYYSDALDKLLKSKN
jgi:hypothetical protein